MDNFKMFKGKKEARRKCAYLQTVLDEGTTKLNISDPRAVYRFWREIDRIKSRSYIKNKSDFYYNFFTLLRDNYSNFETEKIENVEDVEKEIAYICYILGM